MASAVESAVSTGNIPLAQIALHSADSRCIIIFFPAADRIMINAHDASSFSALADWLGRMTFTIVFLESCYPSTPVDNI